MKVYCYNEPIYDQNDELVGNEVLEVTDEQILYDYWQYWEPKMIEKYGEGHELITHENCIEDWVIVNWAWEKKNG